MSADVQSLSDTDKLCLQFLKDIYEISEACGTRTYIWGGMTIDILQGRILREHHDIDGFVLNMLDVREEMTRLFEARGYKIDYMDEVDILSIEKPGFHAGFNRLEIDGDIAMWRGGGDEGTLYFPRQWLDNGPIDFYDTKAYISGIEFEYVIKSHPKMLHPEWETREQDHEAIVYLKECMDQMELSEEDILKKAWSYTPYWAKRGYPEYAMPMVAWPLEPR